MLAAHSNWRHGKSVISSAHSSGGSGQTVGGNTGPSISRSLEKAAKAILETIGPQAVCVCESNSLRLAIKPGLFIIVKHKNNDDFKPSAGDVAACADKIITFDGSNFDISLDSIRFVDGKWAFADTLNKCANAKRCGR